MILKILPPLVALADHLVQHCPYYLIFFILFMPD